MSIHEKSTQIDDASGQISHVGIKPPPFWKANPSLWFCRLEAQFTLAKITCQTTKFNHVVASIDVDILSSVSDIISNVPADYPYDTLKTRLIEAHSESEESKIRRLLQGLELGDSRPSHLLSRMRSLAGSTVGETLLKSLWLARLPTTSRSILGALNNDLPQLAAVADKIHDLAVPQQVHEVAIPTPAQPLEAQIAQLTQQVSELAAIVRQRDTSNPRVSLNNRERSRSRSRQRFKEPSNNLCFYHTNFGDKAKKCEAPCLFFQKGNPLGAHD